MSVAEFSALPKKKQKQKQTAWMRENGACYAFARTGNCKHGKGCKFDHVKLPESMSSTKKGAKEKKKKEAIFIFIVFLIVKHQCEGSCKDGS